MPENEDQAKRPRLSFLGLPLKLEPENKDQAKRKAIDRYKASIILLVISVLFLFKFSVSLFDTLTFNSNAITCPGTCESYKEICKWGGKYSRGTYVYRVKYSYEVNGILYRGSDDIGKWHLTPENLTVYYLPDNPGTSRLERSFPLLDVSVVAVSGIIAIICLFEIVKRNNNKQFKRTSLHNAP